MDRNAGANMWSVGWIMDYEDRKETFTYIFSYLCFDYYRVYERYIVTSHFEHRTRCYAEI